MPGLLRGMARVAVVSGTATAVSNRVSRRQASRWGGDAGGYYEEPPQAQPPPQAPPPQPVAAAPADDPITRLQELGELKSQGLLTEEEFAAAKAKVLAG